MSLQAEWARCRPWIEAALEGQHGTHTLDDVWAQIASGKAQFWPGKRAAVVTEFFHYPRRSALNFWLLGGDPVELVRRMRPCIEEWAEAYGATLFLGFGRPEHRGWANALQRHGYRPDCIGYAKDIANG